MRSRGLIILAAALAVVIGVFFIFKPEKAVEEINPTIHLWNVEASDITHIAIELPRENQAESFIKISDGSNFPWVFDDAERSPVDADKWGGGITLLLSGPGADRVIARSATEEQLETYGLNDPLMVIEVTLTGGDIINIAVGDSTPDGDNYYIKVPNTNGVATVDSSWYEVISSLVVDPPYAETPAEETS